jgi:hypothetical protein
MAWYLVKHRSNSTFIIIIIIIIISCDNSSVRTVTGLDSQQKQGISWPVVGHRNLTQSSTLS